MKVSFVSYVAEYIGTFFLILSIFASGGNPIVIGGALAIVVLLVGSISGALINPAVSLAMYMNGSISPIDLFKYVFVQLLGGVSAFYAFNAVK